MKSNGMHSEKILSQVIAGVSIATCGAYKQVSDTQAVKINQLKHHKVSIVASVGSEYDSALGFLLGENLADALIIQSDMDPFSIMRTALSVNCGEGVLFICGNEKLQRENFVVACNLLEESGISSEVVFTRDIDQPESSDLPPSYRTNAELFFCTKLAGGAAAAGLKLKDIYRMLRAARSHIRSVSFSVDEERSSIAKKQGQESFPELFVNRIAYQLLSDFDLEKNDAVCVYVSGFGGVGFSDLAIITYYFQNKFKEKGINLIDVVINPISSASERKGVAISMMAVRKELRGYYDCPCESFYYKKVTSYCRRGQI